MLKVVYGFILILLLQACASSDVSRGAAGQADEAYLSSRYMLSHAADGSIREAYQNTSQTTKGAVVGGALGAIAGSTSSIGLAPGIAVGAIFGGAIGAYMDSYASLSDKIANRGGQVIVLGDQILIILPSARIFNTHSANINPDAYSTLDVVAQYISTYPNMSVNVSAYTSAAEPERVAFALSEQQAQNVVKYLWRKQINTRLLYAAGYGGKKLVTANTADWDSDNYRIEITLEKLPV